ncbi:E3 ubiquitin-protein ligase Praja-2-like [Anneissia japonica]|uniref:E3 ubiquitin-protein ligase Praja-2-like n=1 Tax=Anneissia japonica TaxID=1529436 RepID=UPI0014258257|nr:E3 ubiquitin-protein ligase Praja-2-like [Anneissia japonica]
MASVKEPVADSQLTKTPKVVSKSKGQKQCDVKSKKKKSSLTDTAKIWHNSKNDNGCFRLRNKSPARARGSGSERNEKNKRRSNSNCRTPLLSECLGSSNPESRRDWEKEGGRPKCKSATALPKESIPQERLVKGDQLQKPGTKKSNASPKLQKKYSSKAPWKSHSKKKKSFDKNLKQSSTFSKYSNSQARLQGRHSSKKREHSKTNEKIKMEKKCEHSQRSKILGTSKKSGKREHHSTSDSQSPSDELQLSPRYENTKQKNAPKHESKTTSQSKPRKKCSNHRVVPETELPSMEDTSDSDSEHPARINIQPTTLRSVRFPMENDSGEDWDVLDPLAEPFSDVARPFIEFHQHFLSTLLAGIFSPSSSDWDSDDDLNEEDYFDEDEDVRTSNENNSAEHDGDSSSNSSSDSESEDLFVGGRNHPIGSSHRDIASGDNSSQPDGVFDSDPLMASGYNSEHSAEDTDISEDDLIYRVAEDYDQLDPLLSLALRIPQLSVGEFILHRQLQFAQDMLHTLYENVVMIIASHPELQNDGAPPPATEETIAKLPCVVATKNILGDNTSCAICRSDYVLDEKLTELPCKHMFHPICIAAWLHKSGTCPVCRFQLQPPATEGT